MKRKGWNLASPDESIDWDVAYRRDPIGLMQAVGAALNEQLRGDPVMDDWDWALDWTSLPGAISVMVAGTAKNPERVQCPTFIASTSVATYEEVDGAADRLRKRIRRTLEEWKHPPTNEG